MFGNPFGNAQGGVPGFGIGGDGVRNVIGADSGMHLEQQFGNIRYDLTGGKMSTVIGTPGGLSTVFGSDGTSHVEQQMGNLRFHLDGSGFDQIL